MLFGKNSDRQRNEAQVVECQPGGTHDPDSLLACTYRYVKQAPKTFKVLLCRPFWTWGAEMGANEHGVVIGNEAMGARSPSPAEPALVDMDLVRLALERATTAGEALEILTHLLEIYGQGGNCGHLTPVYYNNGFIIADADEAYVLETVERDWIAERVTSIRALSNGYSIDVPDAGYSKGFFERASAEGWPVQCGLAEAISDPSREHIGFATARQRRSTVLLAEPATAHDARSIMKVLRDHGTDDRWQPSDPVRTICMHAGDHERFGQTTGSLVSAIGRRDAVHWVTATAAACLSVMKPILLDVPLPDLGPPPDDRSDLTTLWWTHEMFHRSVLATGLIEFLESFCPARDALEARMVEQIAAVEQASPGERTKAVAECWSEASDFLAQWTKRVGSTRFPKPLGYDDAWRTFDRIARPGKWPIGPAARH